MPNSGLNETARPTKEASLPTEPAPRVAVRELGHVDLPRVISIERRSFASPWSVGMFALEMSKPDTVSLAAVEDSRLIGYLILSRYDRAWHLMNIAVAPEHRRRGTASVLIDEALSRIDEQAPGHPGSQADQPFGNQAVREPRFPLVRSAPGLLPGQRGRRIDHVEGRSGSRRCPRRVVRGTASRYLNAPAGDRDLLRRHLCRRPRRPAGAFQRHLVSGRARALRGGRSRGRIPPPPRAGDPGSRSGPCGSRSRLRRSRLGRGDCRPRTDRRAAGRSQYGQSDRRSPGSCRCFRPTISRATSPPTSLNRIRSSRLSFA